MEATRGWEASHTQESAPTSSVPPSTWTVPTWDRDGERASSRGVKFTLILRALFPLIGLLAGSTIWAIHRFEGGSWNAAKEISLRQSDLPAGTMINTAFPAGPHYVAPTAAGPCSPVHSEPFTADYGSPAFDISRIGDDFVYSEVVMMPSWGDASSALRAISAPGYDTQCFQPAFDDASKAMIPRPWCGAFHFDSSSIDGLPTDGFPESAVAYQYRVVMSCTKVQDQGVWYTDIVSVQVGGAFIQGTFTSYEAPLEPGIEQRAMNAMADRAYSLITGEHPPQVGQSIQGP